MNIIDELRSIAKFIDKGLGVELNSITDRLAASGALVPVPQGEACAIIDMETDLFIYEGVIYQVPDGEFYGVPIYDDRPHFLSFHGDSETIVQPVALVPITEAEV